MKKRYIWFPPGGSGDIILFSPALRKHWNLNKDKEQICLVLGNRTRQECISEYVPYFHEREFLLPPEECKEARDRDESHKLHNLAAKRKYPGIKTLMDLHEIPGYKWPDRIPKYNSVVQRFAAYIPRELKDDEKRLEVFISDEDRAYAKKIFPKRFSLNEPTLLVSTESNRTIRGTARGIAEAGISQAGVRQVIEVGTKSVLGYKYPFIKYSKDFHPRRSVALLEMCYGLVGVHSMLLWAAVAMGKPSWIRWMGISPDEYKDIIGFNELVTRF